MTKYVSLPFNKKLNLLRDHSLGCDWPDLDQEHWCLHCRKKFNGHSVRVWKSTDNRLWLECGTPDCDGSPIDWAPYPWWNPKHRATKDYLKKAKAEAKLKPRARRGRTTGDSDDVPF
jgi:hypothetical protein